MELISRKYAKTKGFKRYFTGKPCKRGHISERLVSKCECVECKKEISKEYREENKEREKSRAKEYYEKNKEQCKERMRGWREENKGHMKESREENKDKIKDLNKDYYEKNKEQRKEYMKKWNKKNKEWRNEYMVKWNKRNPFQRFVRSNLRRMSGSLTGERKVRIESLVGYTQEQFIKHIESQFKVRMSWCNRSEWHIDHIKPIKAFIDEGITDPKIINALGNLQPLWAKDNLSKGAKYEG